MCSTVGIRGASFWMNMAYKDAFSWCLTRLIYRSKKYGDLKTSCGSWLEATKRFHSWTELPDCFPVSRFDGCKTHCVISSYIFVLKYVFLRIKYPIVCARARRPHQQWMFFEEVRYCTQNVLHKCFGARKSIYFASFTLHHNLYRYIYIHGWRQMDR